ncbi:hypothetical protein [Compostimonas suwonensis]|uniref:Multidrug ABC transporter ATPase n=1 Tax=Compostimonas suwonensis TaxID=1048394 RepID=A0A2M9BVJ6_9MICO|nr:hypothetical protein [Compostimonas suwonensis]PJJ61979.1 hypothetical protein CLV54_1770 [Compostimonas suwonensis]
MTSDPAQTPAPSVNRAERALAYMAGSIVALSILCFIAILIGTSAGAGANDGFSKGLWPSVILLPYFGLPIGFLLLLALVIVSAVRRRRETRGNNNG